MPNNVTAWLDFAVQQMAAESYLDGIDHQSQLQVRPRLLAGNNRGVDPNTPDLTGKTRFTGLLADRFLNNHQIVDHHANDATGFSATLLKYSDEENQEHYTLSFRSLEYRYQGDGGDWERDGANGAVGEIADFGFALAQLVSMERYWRKLTGPSGKLAAGTKVDVTGYSLGGHLATLFTELHSGQVVRAYTFNAAGRGTFRDLFQSNTMLETLEVPRIQALLSDMESRIDAFDPSRSLTQSGAADNIYLDSRYNTAVDEVMGVYATIGTAEIQIRRGLSGDGFLQGISRTDGAFGQITQLFGHAETGLDAEIVATSGIHTTTVPVLVEGQPLYEGLQIGEDQYGNAHSLTLLVDALALQDLFHNIDHTLTQGQVEDLFRAGSSAKAQAGQVLAGAPNVAEGNTLEKALDMLRKIFLGPTLTPETLPFDSRGGGFGNLANRNAFYEGIDAVAQQVSSQTFQIDSLVAQSPSAASAAARQNDDTGLAYRYALKELNPFVVRGADYSQHNANGELDLYNAATGEGTWTLVALSDRAELLAELVKFNEANGPASTASFTLYEDQTIPFNNSRNATATEVVIFGDIEGRELVGRSGNDHLYGGDGDDLLQGGAGLDYLEGNADNDQLFGGADSDILLGGQGNDELDGGDGLDTLNGGLDNDILRGGTGTDTYQYRTGFGLDQIDDSDGKGIIQFDLQTLQGGIHRDGDSANTYHSADGQFIFVWSGGGDLTINSAVTVNNFVDGQFGLHLVDASDFTNGAVPTIDYTNDFPTFTKIDGDGDDTEALLGNTNYIVHGNGGDDFLLTAQGNDQLFGGAGSDTLQAGSGQDQLLGDDGNDSLNGNAGQDVMYGGLGNDVLNGDTANNLTIVGDDYLDGGAGDDLLQGQGGDDALLGGEGHDILIADDDAADAMRPAGKDYVEGGDGFDKLYGGLGDDHLMGGPDDDRMFGDNIPADPSLLTTRFSADGGNDFLEGGDGNDYLQGDGGDDILLAGAGHDRLYGDDQSVGMVVEGSDWVDGGDADDVLLGGTCDDVARFDTVATLV